PNTIHAAKGINAGGVAWHNSSGNKNGYLTHFGENWQQPCPLQRILMVDSMVISLLDTNMKATGIIDSANGILGNTVKEDTLLSFSVTQNAKILSLYGLNMIFENDNLNASRNGIPYDSLLNIFVTKAKRKGIHCSFISAIDSAVFEGAKIYNLTDSISKYNFNWAGKLSFIQLEHEFWNADEYPSKTTTQWNFMTDVMKNAHFDSIYNEHLDFLDTLNIQRYKDANFLGVHDYIDRLYFNWSSSANLYDRDNHIARKLKAAELEKKSNAIYLTHYKKYWEEHDGLTFFVIDTNTSKDTTGSAIFRERISFFGQNPNRLTYIFPTFSGEWFNIHDSSDFCGHSYSKPWTTQYLGSYFRDTTDTSGLNNFSHVEDTFLIQYQTVFIDSGIDNLDSVIISGFGWFKYTCLSDLSFGNADLNPCLSLSSPYAESIVYKPKEGKEENDNENSEAGLASNNDYNGVLKIYPNPASEHIRLIGPSELGFVSIMSSSGRRIQKIYTSNKAAILDISNLKPGLYFVETKSKGIVNNIKFIKQ
ncbi:MAG: T9SS type A sorting domain-containing protein, partial [Flavobacteriales bacterium]|nr:T9SS type A sorting domain-containing protein [Flavobacteriales bacterium]